MPAHAHSAWTDSQGWHSHGFQMYTNTGSTDNNFPSSYDTHQSGVYKWTDGSGNHTHGVGIGNTGSNQSHNIMQPYIAVYIWKRSA